MDRRLLPLITLGLAVITAAVLAVLPFMRSEVCTTHAGEGALENVTECDSSTSSLVESEGAGVLAVFAVPAVVTLAGVARPTRPVLVAVAVLLGAGVVLTGFSIGLFYVPTAVAAALAASRSPDR